MIRGSGKSIVNLYFGQRTSSRPNASRRLGQSAVSKSLVRENRKKKKKKRNCLVGMASPEKSADNKSSSQSSITEAQRARSERNKQKALQILQSKLVAHPYSKKSAQGGNVIRSKATKVIDTGGGFLLEETEEGPLNLRNDAIIVEDPGPILPPDLPTCEECQKEFQDSWLHKNFDYSVCDGCRDNEDKHTLITKTDAKQEYLLKDCDLDLREPVLKYIVRKNPHNSRWGDMKLYLHVQIEQRALEVWGSEERLLEEREHRDDKRSLAKVKKYNKQLKALRMNVRSSLYDRTTVATHTHSFGAETYNEEDDTYTRSCETCPFTETFEKM